MCIACVCVVVLIVLYRFVLFGGFFFFKQKTAYEMRISDWSSDVCSSDLRRTRWTASRRQGPGQPHASRRIARRRAAPDAVGRRQAAARPGQAGFDPPEAAPGRKGQGRDRRAAQRDRAGHRSGREEHEARSEEHTSEIQSLMRISYAGFCLKK